MKIDLTEFTHGDIPRAEHDMEDAGARRQALDPARSFIVQAPAGSGKTELLIQRILALLGTAEQPEEVLAITFTRKAAGEMRERLFRALLNAHGKEPESDHEKTSWRLAKAALDNGEKRGWRLLEHPARLRVQTIDSFCANLVRRMPWLSRFGAQAAVSDDPGALYRLAAERVLTLAEKGGFEGSAGMRLLFHLDNRAERFRDLLVSMLARRDQWLRHLAAREERQRSLLEEGLEAMARQALTRLHDLLQSDLRPRLLKAALYAGGNLSDREEQGSLARLAGMTGFPEPDPRHLNQWLGLCELLLTSGNEFRKRLDRNCGFPPGKDPSAVAMKQFMGDILDELRDDRQLLAALVAVRQLPPLVYDESQWDTLQDLVRLLPRAVAELWLVFQERGQTDFVEIAQAAHRALGGDDRPTDLMLYLDSRIRHILVDEFQDTSWGQFLLLQKLTAGWQPGDGRSLFLVGDPMQSIYRFREAEVGLYLRARRLGIGGVSLVPLNLTANFRSQQKIVDWVNDSFPLIFPVHEDEMRGAVRYARSQGVRDPLDGAGVTFHPLIERNDREEAERVVAIVKQAMTEDPAGKIAILVRARGHLLEIARALRQAGLNYLAQEIDPLIDRPVARDLLVLTRALLHAGDRVAHLAVLRAPWCGLTLAELDALVGEEADKTVPELLRDLKRIAALSSAARKRAEKVLDVLNRTAVKRGRVPLRQLVEGAWLALGGPACVNPGELQDAAVILQMLEDLDQGGDLLPFESFAQKLADLYASPDPGSGESLQLMTIHKAKGLEFDTVILPGLGRKPRRGESPLLRWLELPSGELLLGPIAPLDGQSRDPVYDAIGRLDKEKEDLEVCRILYVAATRARKRLHLLGHARVRDGNAEGEPGSLLEKLWPVAAPAYAAASCEEVEPEAGQTNFSRSIRRLPAEWKCPSLPSADDFSAPETVLRPSSLGRTTEAFSLALDAEDDRHIGNVCHSLLERISRDGLKAWSEERRLAAEPDIRHQLMQSGLHGHRLEKALGKTLRVLERMLTSARARWILDSHREAECELALSGILDGRIVHGILDRTFIDSDGVRWIIDYKTSEPKGNQSEQAFLAREGERYRGQLSAYRKLLEGLEPRNPIRTALYFPLFDGWFEMDF
ncbi:MAG: UvrD-helicase domain-containing protein [Syntrophotaleaceae bacterium]